VLPVTVTAITGLAALAAQAGATVRVQNHNDPAGDPAITGYRLENANMTTPPLEFSLHDAEDRSFGPGPGTYVIRAAPPAGWQVGDIQCVGPSPAEFMIDIPNGLVTLTHGPGYEQTCSFTNRRVPASSTSGAPQAVTPGVAPSPPPEDIPKIVLPDKAGLLRVTSGRRFAAATLRITRQSIIKGQLLRGKVVVGTARIVRPPGTHIMRVRLAQEFSRGLSRQGRKAARLTLRVVVVPSGAPTQVFRFGVRIPL
jgi:hypothetical protein